VAREKLDLAEYRDTLMRTLSPTSKVMWNITSAAKRDPKRIVFCEGQETKVLRAANIVREEGIGYPILIGRRERIAASAAAAGIDISGMEIVETRTAARLEEYVDSFAALRARKGVTRYDALRILSRRRTYFGMMMLRHGHADVVVSGLTHRYPETITPALEVIGVRDGVKRACGMHLVVSDRDVLLLADTTLNVQPDAETLCEIALHAAEAAAHLGMVPRVALLSFSTFGSAAHDSSIKVAAATRLLRQKRPDLNVDGEMQADVALDEELRARFPFSNLRGRANVLVFPNLDAGNIAYKLQKAQPNSEVIGPITLGLKQPVALLTQESSVDDIVHLTTIAASRAIEGTVRLAAE
jgi:malate dehydrogenase (oxaloacetate-decarboxylating)(NADP+)